MEEIEKGTITRAALGRLGFIGELYDARTESFSCRCLFKSSLSEDAIQRRDLGRMEYDFKFTENILDCLNLLQVEGELQMGILCNLVSLDGSGKFLSSERKSEKAVACTLYFKLQTICEKFYAAWNEVLDDIDLNALEDAKYTHVIVECTWGANCLLNLESYCRSDAEMKEKKGILGAEVPKLGKLLSIKTDGKLEKVDKGSVWENNIHIKVMADVTPKNGWPTSVEEFCNFMKEVPGMVENLNGGKGKPLNYVMLPLSTIRKLAKIDTIMENAVVNISEGFVLSTVCFLDQIATLKRKFNDQMSVLEQYKKYIKREEYENCEKQQNDLLVKESNLKQLIGENWTSVRSGVTSLMDFITKLEEAKCVFNVCSYKAFLDSCQKINKKLSVVQICLSKGIEYLGTGDSFSDVLAKDPFAEFVIFITSEETKDTELSENTFHFFISLVEDPKPNTKYIVVDLDLGTTIMGNKMKAPKCVNMKGSRVISHDMYEEYMSDLMRNFARPQQGCNAELMKHKPGNRVHLKMTCPNFENGICGNEEVEWTCFRCKGVIEYGFNDYFYCMCGFCKWDSYMFRCCSPKHGNDFVRPKGDFLKKMLSKLSPLEEMNILILGQSGVGKSTWINSIINYLKYESLEDAEREGVICTIPSTFVMHSKKTSSQHIISVGEESSNEESTIGNSATQCSHTYSFLWENRLVRLIDTPGLGDTRGIEQDKINVENVISHLKYYKHLHGVCILLKAGENRVHSFLQYCIKELLVNLHKSVTRNIVFCFTNARNTFYGPGAVTQVLSKMFRKMKIDKELSLGEHNTFCLDNEAFLFLCSLKYPEIQHEEHLKASYLESWNISLVETKKLFNTIYNFEPHDLQSTITLFTARNQILCLTPALAEISKTIHLNVAAREKQQIELENSKKSVEQLEKMLIIKDIQLVPSPLPYPMTVCTSPRCVNYVQYKSIDITEIEYKTICHQHCYLKNVEVKTVNNPVLRGCEAMVKGFCKNCKCSYENHMHITFCQKRVEKEVLNKDVESDMIKEKSKKQSKEEILESLKSNIEEYKKEQEFIIQVTVKFGIFLKHNAISAYNDGVADYLKHLIRQEENKLYKTEEEEKLLIKMKQTLEQYKEEVKIFEDLLSKADKPESISVDEVLNLEQELYKLKHTGESIKKNVEMQRRGVEQMKDYLETAVQLSQKKRRSVEKGKENSTAVPCVKNVNNKEKEGSILGKAINAGYSKAVRVIRSVF